MACLVTYLIDFFRPDGWLYDKEVIYEYVITKKNEYSRALKEFERLKKKEDKELAELAALEEANKVEKFVKAESNITVKSTYEDKSKLIC